MTFEEFRNEYKKLNSEEERIDFINNRIKQLISEASPIKSIGMGINGSFNEFIAPNVGVVSNETKFFSELLIDDMDVYKEFMNFIHNDVDNCLRGEPVTIKYIQDFIWKYFGYNSGDPFLRMEMYDIKNDYISIKDFKGINMATCSERSALVQNLLKFLGFDSEIIIGKLNETNSHAYIVFKTGSGTMRILYDPMNPVEYDVNGVKYYCAGVSMMTEDEYDYFKSGGSYTFKYDLVKKIYVGDHPCKEDPREYLCDDMKYTINGDESLNDNFGLKM